MTITIGANIASLRGIRQLDKASSGLRSTFERLSSGTRINKASDDAAGLAIAEALNADSRIYNQAVRNLNDGLSLLNIADSAINNLTDIAIRLEELATQASNSVYGATQRKAIDAEAQALAKEFTRIIQTTEFNDQKLFTGDLQELNLQAGVGADAILQASIGGAIGTGEFNPYFTHVAGGQQNVSTNGDFNGDGHLDLAVGTTLTGDISILLGSGDGTFSEAFTDTLGAASYINTGDFNGDGVLDLAVNNSSNINVLIGNGDGSFNSAISLDVGNNSTTVQIGDINGDGHQDLVTARANDSSIGAFLGNGDGTFSDVMVSTVSSGNSTSVAIADFDGDGILDAAVSGGAINENVYLLKGFGDGTFGSETIYGTADSVNEIQVADFNNDGHLDLYLDGRGMLNGVMLNDGQGSFGSQTSISLGAASNDSGFGDFNGDGFLDIAAVLGATDTTGIWLGAGDGSFVSDYTVSAGDFVRAVEVGDYDSDGVADLAVSSRDDNTVNILLGRTRDGIAPILPFSLETVADARQALPLLSRKRELLATQRGEVGVAQSRIEVAQDVLRSASENFLAAASRIRDVDLGQETSRLTRFSILQQASTAILAQANQQPALVLSLLKG